MQTIELSEGIATSLRQIYCATESITVNFHGELKEESVFTLILIANIIENRAHETIASIDGCIPLFPAITADRINLAPDSTAYIVPIRIIVDKSTSEADKSKQIETVKEMNKVIRKLYKKYPKLQALFDDGEDHFLTKEGLIANGVDVID